MNKKLIEQILKEEIEAIINEEELDEQGFASKIGGFLKNLRRPAADQRAARRKKRQQSGDSKTIDTPRTAQPPSVDKPKQKKRYETISLKQLADELMDNLPASAKAIERSKFSKLINNLKASYPDGIKVGDQANVRDNLKTLNSEMARLATQIKNIQARSETLKTSRDQLFKNSPISKDNMKKMIKKANKVADVDPQILNYLFGLLKDKDDFILVEALLTKVIAEHLKGNKVVL